MPTMFNEAGFRFFFYSNEGFESCHVHVIGHDGEAKFWIPSCVLAWSYNLNAGQLRRVYNIINANRSKIEEAWNEHFNS